MNRLLAIGLCVLAASCDGDDGSSDDFPEDLVVDSDRIFLDSDDVDSDVTSDDVLDDFMDGSDVIMDAPFGEIFLSESSVDFGAVVVGGPPAQRIVEVFNNSPTDVFLGQIDVAGPSFRLDQTTCGSLLLAGSSCGLLLMATPETLGEQVGDLLVRTDFVTLFATLRVIGIR